MELRDIYGTLQLDNVKWREYLGDRGICGRIMIKWTLNIVYTVQAENICMIYKQILIFPLLS
jgi:hypothetical protein